MLTHLFPPSIPPVSLDSFREHPERKGPHRARGWDAAGFNEPKEGNKMLLRGGPSERITTDSQESVPHRGRGAGRFPQAGCAGPHGPGEWKTTKGKEGKERVEEGNERHCSCFQRAQAGPFQRADTLCRKSRACPAPLKAMATISVVQSGIIFWVPGAPCLGCPQWL